MIRCSIWEMLYVFKTSGMVLILDVSYIRKRMVRLQGKSEVFIVFLMSVRVGLGMPSIVVGWMFTTFFCSSLWSKRGCL